MERFADTHVHIDINEPAKVQELLDIISGLGVTDTTLLALCTNKTGGILQNLSVLWWKTRYDKMKIRAFGHFHETDIYAGIPYEEQLEYLLRLGCDGIKFLQAKPDKRKMIGKGLNHPDYDKALSIMEERGIPALIHSGDPETFWDIDQITPGQLQRGWFYGDGTYLSNEEHYNEIYEMLDKHPGLKVSLAHFFFLSNRLDEAKRVMEKYPNVSFGLTPGWEMFLGFSKNIDAWHDFFEQYSDRILFGTDSNNTKNENDMNQRIHQLVWLALTHDKTEFLMPCYSKQNIKGLDLSQETIENICYHNFVNFAGAETVSVDLALLQRSAEKILADIKDIPKHQEDVVWLQNFLKCF